MKFLVIHVDQTGADDVAEVAAVDADDAATAVQAFPDTAKVLYAIGFDGEPPAIYRFEIAHNAFMGTGRAQRLGATEGDALEEAAEDPADLEHVSEQPVESEEHPEDEHEA